MIAIQREPLKNEREEGRKREEETGRGGKEVSSSRCFWKNVEATKEEKGEWEERERESE